MMSVYISLFTIAISFTYTREFRERFEATACNRAHCMQLSAQQAGILHLRILVLTDDVR
jgi:hypothetical protein